MSAIAPTRFLRRALWLDAAASAATGLLMLIGADPLAGLLGLPPALLRMAGWILLPYAGFVALVARRDAPSPGAVWAVIVCNVVWVAASIAILVQAWVAPSALGYAFVIAQALVVGALAETQFIGLRRRNTIAVSRA